MPDFNLDRFLAAQTPVYHQVIAELRGGRKRTHWMWFIFPQLAGLGQSAMARRFAIASLGEARAYLAHEVLGERLLVCTGLVNAAAAASAHDVFGTPDDMKFQSCVTLFGRAGGGEVFAQALHLFYAGAEDERTAQMLD